MAIYVPCSVSCCLKWLFCCPCMTVKEIHRSKNNNYDGRVSKAAAVALPTPVAQPVPRQAPPVLQIKAEVITDKNPTPIPKPTAPDPNGIIWHLES